MKVAITGASGFIGTELVARLADRGDEVTVLSRSGAAASSPASSEGWDPMAGPSPAGALRGHDAVIHLAGEPVAQRWTDDTRRRILDSREVGTRNLVEGLARVPEAERPTVLVSGSAVGYYGAHGEEEVTEGTAPGDSFLSDVAVRWERAADVAADLGLRVVHVRTGVVLGASGGTLKSLLSQYRMGLGGPVAGGRQYVPWIHLDDIVGIFVRAADDSSWSGAYNGTAPAPVTQKVFAEALGRAMGRPAVVPVPGFVVRLLLGDMAEMVTTGQRAIPRRAVEGGYTFAHTDLDAALADALHQRRRNRGS